MQRIHLLTMFIPIQLSLLQVAKTEPWWSYSLFFFFFFFALLGIGEENVANC